MISDLPAAGRPMRMRVGKVDMVRLFSRDGDRACRYSRPALKDWATNSASPLKGAQIPIQIRLLWPSPKGLGYKLSKPLKRGSNFTGIKSLKSFQDQDELFLLRDAGFDF